MSTSTSHVAPSIKLAEALRFSAQLLLDDIINAANNAQAKSVEALETFVIRWAEERANKRGDTDWDEEEEAQKGIASFQTLTEYHTDVAFDFFEVWCMRNIFLIPPELDIVMPHHEGLNLNEPVERDVGLRAEYDELRKKIARQRRIKRLQTHALRRARRERTLAEQQLSRLSTILDSHTVTLLSTIPPKIKNLSDNMLALEPREPQNYKQESGGKRPWETGSEQGYLEWAEEQLRNKGKEALRTELQEFQDQEVATGSTVSSATLTVERHRQ